MAKARAQKVALSADIRHKAFGSFRAEWLSTNLYTLFTEPDIFPYLKNPQTCVIVGARGTGKTTMLRCLSYEGQAALNEETFGEFVGIYYRIDPIVASAIGGPELSDEQWCAAFAHYINHELVLRLLRFATWYGERRSKALALNTSELEEVAIALRLEERPGSLADLERQVRLSLLRLESRINSPSELPLDNLSMLGRPLDLLCAAIARAGEVGRTYFLLDEFETLNAGQQKVLNTLVKRGSEHYFFKLGLREFGWKTMETTTGERLEHPADFMLFEVENSLEGSFASFAAEVCNRRLRQVSGDARISVTDFFPELTIEQEADVQEVDDALSRELAALTPTATDREFLESLPKLEAFVACWWARSHQEDLSAVISLIRGRPKSWLHRYENYKYVVLFLLRKGKRGHRKLYAGWRTLTLLAANNIRLLLELVDMSFRMAGDSAVAISPQDQTSASHAVAEKHLRSLSGYSARGDKLIRLVLGVGRVLQLMASNPEAHAPEVNMFIIEDELVPELRALLQDGLMNLALIRRHETKLAPDDPRGFEYSLHPIFCPFFYYSHRKKRHFAAYSAELLDLIDDPRRGIAALLRRAGRAGHVQEALPEQLGLFGEYYGVG